MIDYVRDLRTLKIPRPETGWNGNQEAGKAPGNVPTGIRIWENRKRAGIEKLFFGFRQSLAQSRSRDEISKRDFFSL